jgi:hypothetical protein
METTKCSNCRDLTPTQPDFCLLDTERIEPPNRKWKRTDLTMFVKIIQRLLLSRAARAKLDRAQLMQVELLPRDRCRYAESAEKPN